MSTKHTLRRRLATVELGLFGGAPAGEGEVEAYLGPLAEQEGGDDGPVRVKALAAIAAGSGDRSAYRDRWGVCGVRRFATASGVHIYLIPVETFPRHVNNLYLVQAGSSSTLFDVGSPAPSTREELGRAGLVLAQIYGERDALERVTDVVISHGHIDHFGGLAAFSGRARVHVHELDQRVVTGFEERVALTALELGRFLERAGTADADALVEMYAATKGIYRSLPVDHLLEEHGRVNGWTVHHAPGHCPGQVCLQVENVLLTADHVLSRITPHQSPEALTPSAGLGTYLESLDKIRRLGGIDLALPGHEAPITALVERIDEIVAFHRQRLADVQQRCAEPHTIDELALSLFGPQRSYGRLLALLETGAHVEWLHQRGRLEVVESEHLLAGRRSAYRYGAVGGGAGR